MIPSDIFLFCHVIVYVLLSIDSFQFGSSLQFIILRETDAMCKYKVIRCGIHAPFITTRELVIVHLTNMRTCAAQGHVMGYMEIHTCLVGNRHVMDREIHISLLDMWIPILGLRMNYIGDIIGQLDRCHFNFCYVTNQCFIRWGLTFEYMGLLLQSLLISTLIPMKTVVHEVI